MKLIKTITILTIALSCKAQTEIRNLEGDSYCPPYDNNCYEKDVNNEFEKFTGEWKYQSGNTSITIILKKELHYQTTSNANFEDLLVGEYQYIDNGNEIFNTLNDINNLSISGYEHNISGGLFTRHLPQYCIDNSTPQEIKVELFIDEPNTEFIEGRIILRYVNDNGVEKLEACIFDQTLFSGNPNDRISVPDGYYVFIKQD